MDDPKVYTLQRMTITIYMLNGQVAPVMRTGKRHNYTISNRTGMFCLYSVNTIKNVIINPFVVSTLTLQNVSGQPTIAKILGICYRRTPVCNAALPIN
jgi:hypothetical protein